MQSVLIYGFPLILLLFEWGLRTALSVDASSFLGPTLAATGLSFLVPLTKPKSHNIHLKALPGAIVISKGDHNLIAFIWLLLLLYLFVWAASCYMSIRHPMTETFGLAHHVLIGFGAYFFSLIMIFIKEKV